MIQSKTTFFLRFLNGFLNFIPKSQFSFSNTNYLHNSYSTILSIYSLNSSSELPNPLLVYFNLHLALCLVLKASTHYFIYSSNDN